jgi:hypothetical protein
MSVFLYMLVVWFVLCMLCVLRVLCVRVSCVCVCECVCLCVCCVCVYECASRALYLPSWVFETWLYFTRTFFFVCGDIYLFLHFFLKLVQVVF